MGGTRNATRLLAAGATIAALVGVGAGCGDDGPSASDVSDNLVQACADALGLDPDDFAQFSDIDDYDELTDAFADNTDEFEEFTDEFTDEFEDEFTEFQTDFGDEFSDEFTEAFEATDEDEQQGIIDQITDSEALDDLVGPFGGCGAFIRALVLAGVAGQFTDEVTDDFTDFTDFTGSGEFTDDSGSGDFTDDSGSANR